MSVWHGDLRKRKPSGGRKKPYRGKRKFESGSFPTETSLGEPKRKMSRRRGGNVKIRLLSGNYANVTDPTTGRTERVEILTVLRNLSNADY
ncbi:MAG: 30S ribosomal protein S8e, partial [Candidatus Bathyarchaeota archaeon]|nr:30S ribosomal protein S8e [Candidatus Bathyarchaeota archaeon]